VTVVRAVYSCLAVLALFFYTSASAWCTCIVFAIYFIYWQMLLLVMMMQNFLIFATKCELLLSVVRT